MDSQKERHENTSDVQNYSELTVAKLKDLHRERGIKIPHNATKAQLLRGLQTNPVKEEPTMATEPAKPTPAHTPAKPEPAKTEPAAKRDAPKMEIPQARTDTKDETRLFQTSPDKKEFLTQKEAEGKGMYWRDEKKLGKA